MKKKLKPLRHATFLALRSNFEKKKHWTALSIFSEIPTQKKQALQRCWFLCAVGWCFGRWDGACPKNFIRFCGHLLLCMYIYKYTHIILYCIISYYIISYHIISYHIISLNSGGHCSFCQTCEASCRINLVSFSSKSNLCDQKILSEIPGCIGTGQWHNTIQLPVELHPQLDMQYNRLTHIYRQSWRFQTLDIREYISSKLSYFFLQVSSKHPAVVLWSSC